MNPDIAQRIVVSLVLLSATCLGQSSKDSKDAKATKNLTTQSLKLFGGCIYLSGTGNAQTVPFANACNQPMQFTVSWAGGQPPRNITYRINNWGARTVMRQDLQGVVVAEGPAKQGVGAPGKVRVEDRDMGQGQHLLSLVNGESVHIFVYGHIYVRDKSGKQVMDCQPATVVKPLGRERACVYFAGQTYLVVLQADQDPN
jgi:catechol 2,3-dioxygenase-like lactoylglutathione lyase family enzyme